MENALDIASKLLGVKFLPLEVSSTLNFTTARLMGGRQKLLSSPCQRTNFFLRDFISQGRYIWTRSSASGRLVSTSSKFPTISQTKKGRL